MLGRYPIREAIKGILYASIIVASLNYSTNTTNQLPSRNQSEISEANAYGSAHPIRPIQAGHGIYQQSIEELVHLPKYGSRISLRMQKLIFLMKEEKMKPWILF